MTFDYKGAADTALEALKEFGAPVTRRAAVGGSYDPSAGSSATAFVETTRTGVALDFGTGQTTVRGSAVQGSDKRLLLDAAAGAELTDQFVVGGKTHSVVSLSSLAPAGVTILYDLHIRA